MKLPCLATIASLIAAAQAAVDEAFAGSLPCTTPTSYRVTFVSQWTAERHPPDYEKANAHWSGPVYASHTSDYVMWSGGIKATKGVQVVAELGSQGDLSDELDEAGDKILDVEKGGPMFNLNRRDTQEIGEVDVDKEHRYISGISMIADSPDWFSGMHDIDMCDDGVWIDYAEVEGFPYDAGTDDGETYDSRDSANDPVEIFRLTPETVPSSDVFVSSNRKGTRRRVLPVQLTILERVIGDDEVCEDDDGFLFKGRNGRDCDWVADRSTRKRGRICNRKQKVDGEENLVKYFCPEACEICP